MSLPLNLLLEQSRLCSELGSVGSAVSRLLPQCNVARVVQLLTFRLVKALPLQYKEVREVLLLIFSFVKALNPVMYKDPEKELLLQSMSCNFEVRFGRDVRWLLLHFNT